MNDVQPVIYKYKLHVPTDYWLLIKTLVVMEGVGKALAPSFDVFRRLGAATYRSSRSRWRSPRVGRRASSGKPGAGSRSPALFPRQATRVLGRLERGDLELRVDVPEIRQATRGEFNSATNRVVMAILVGAMVIALAMLLPSLHLESWPWDVVTWLIVIGFVFVSIVAFWLIISVLRSLFRR